MIPELRFNDDTTEWVEDTLSSILVETDDRTTLDSGLEHVSLTKEGVIPKSERYDRDHLVTEDNKKYRITRYNDICYNPANLKFGVICRNTYKDGLFSPIYVTFNTTDNVTPEFTELNVVRESFIADALQYQQGTVYERMSVSPEDLGKMPISIPKKHVQTEIATLLSDMDAKIKAQSEKVENLKQIKASMLVKMFPQEGQKVPEIRFDGFSGDWDEKPLSEIADKVTRKNTGIQSDLPLTISSQYGLIDQREFFNKQVASTNMNNYYLMYNGEFAYNKSYSVGYDWGSIKRLDRYDKGAVSTLYILFCLKSGVDSDYVATFYSTDLWYDAISKIAQEGARNHGLLNVPTDEFFTMPILLPSLPEQTAIGNFFKTLDEKITLETERLDKFTQIKKALLNKLLP